MPMNLLGNWLMNNKRRLLAFEMRCGIVSDDSIKEECMNRTHSLTRPWPGHRRVHEHDTLTDKAMARAQKSA